VTITVEARCGPAGLSTAVGDQLERELTELWRRDRIVIADPAGVARLLRHLLDDGGVEAAGARELLRETGIRHRWNAVFAVARARLLAEALAPLLRPPVLDVLAGDCTVSRALVERGVHPVRAVERLWQYPEVDWSRVEVPVSDIGSPGWPDQGERTRLVCAVLHHAPDPVALLDELAGSRTGQRWVIVENCVDPRYGPEFHRFIDEFFNRCLNQFHCSCVPEHRTAAEWTELLRGYGTVEEYRELPVVPGLPFPYQVFVVERS
jgi:hypothetical protein